MSPASRSARAEVGALYASHAPMVHRRVRRFFSAADTPEVVQEIFVKVLERWGSFRGQSSPATWLYRLTTNHCLNRLRDTTRRRDLWDAQGAVHWGPRVEAGGQQARVLLSQLWRELDDELLEVAVMHHLDGMTHAEIARVIGCSRRTVGNRLEELARRVAAHSGAEEETA